MPSAAARDGASYLAGLCGVALWTLAVAYLLPPQLGSGPARLAAYGAGALLSFWLARRTLGFLRR